MRSALIIGLACVTSCSAIIVRSPPESLPPGEAPSCMTSRALPVLDTLVTATAVGLAIAAGAKESEPGVEEFGQGIAIGLAVIVALPVGLSALHGFSATGKCRRLESAFAHDGVAPPAPAHLGARGEACWPDGSCNPGLACTAQICQPAAAPTGPAPSEPQPSAPQASEPQP